MSFAQFFALEFPAISLVSGTTAGNRADGEDIAQEAMARAEAKWAEVSQLDRPGAWVRRVAINLALNRRRGRGRETAALHRVFSRRSVSDNDPQDDHRLGDPAVWAAIDQLPPRQRAVIVLHYFEDRPVAELAEILDCTVSAATSNLHKARTRLAELLGPASSPAPLLGDPS